MEPTQLLKTHRTLISNQICSHPLISTICLSLFYLPIGLPVCELWIIKKKKKDLKWLLKILIDIF